MIRRLFFVVLVPVTLLLCFDSCVNSDNIESDNGALVASLPLKAQIENNASSRVGMTDSYGGTFSSYWNSDKLNIYDQYVLNRIVQNMSPLRFSTTDKRDISATFSYVGTDTYRYNPGSRLYAFSSNTSGGYTASVTSGGVSTLKAFTLASQTGTLADCAGYDALYGSTKVNNEKGLPGSLMMHHLFGMLNLHITSSSFSTSHPVTVTLTSSESNILPGNNGSASLAADGSKLITRGSWGTNWSTTITPTTNGVVDVYLMTWPFNSINGTLTISCSDDIGSKSFDRTVTLNGFSLAAAQLKSEPVSINFYNSSRLFAWDATDYIPFTLGTVATNANEITVASDLSDYSSRALYACKNCPNANEITWYLSVPCYWDDGTISGGNTTNYKMADGNYTKAGMWFRKKSGIAGFSSTKSSGTTSRFSTILNAANIPANLKSDYFFLPAAGNAEYSNGELSDAGILGRYWSSTPCTLTTTAYLLEFRSTSASIGLPLERRHGMCLWQVQ